MVAAVEDELGAEAADLARRCDVVFTGVGKLRAFEATLAAMERHNYAAVVNVGTCGSLVHRAGTVLRPSVVWQGGLYLDSVFATEPERVESGDRDVSLVSVDSFISPATPREELDVLARYDCFEMEGYAILRAAVARALLGSGLFPAFGLFHRNRYNAFPLADDVMEPYRPFVDYVVYRIFECSPTACLDKETKQSLVRVLFADVKMKDQIRPLQVALSMTTASLVRALKDKKESIIYPSFV